MQLRKILLLLCSAALVAAGCGGVVPLGAINPARTTASYETPDGKKIFYSSDKEQVGLEAVYSVDDQGRVKEVRIKVDKAGAQEAAIQAALAQQQAFTELFKTLLPLALKGAGLAVP